VGTQSPSPAESLTARVARLERELAEALAREAATAEVLGVIGRSRADPQPVFQAILERAVRLCDARLGTLYLIDGEHLRAVAVHGATEEFAEVVLRTPLSRDINRLRRAGPWRPLQVPDARETPSYQEGNPLIRRWVDEHGLRTWLGVPLVDSEQYVGSIVIWRQEVRPFTERQIALLESFADQAVVAIENTRVFQELNEALGRETATGEILRVIASSPSDLQPVLQAVGDRALELFDAAGVFMYLVQGDQVVRVAAFGSVAHVESNVVRPLDRTWLSGRALLDRRTMHIEDIVALGDEEYPLSRETQRRFGYRTVMATPMLRDDLAIGLITVLRTEVRPFTQQHIALLETFADQAVIAIENARLFSELERRNRELGEALEQQTATAEVLNAISRSAFELQPVLDTLVENAVKLTRADMGIIRRFDGEVFQWAADFGTTAEWRAYLQDRPVRPGRGSSLGRAALERRTIHIPDVLAAPDYERSETQKELGYRTSLGVPMLRAGNLIGVFSLVRGRVEPFTENQIELVETFADQAVIAIENVRLFGELRDRVEELQALGEIGQTVSSSLDLLEVLTTVVSHAVRLSGADAGTIYELDEETATFSPRASDRMPAELLAAVEQDRLRLADDNLVGRAALRGEAVQVSDLLDQTAFAPSSAQDALRQTGFRALLAVPLVREQRVVGALVIRRKTPGEFPQAVVELLQTFASQSVLAIENARLFEQVQESGRQLAEASQHKSQFLANMSHELRTPLNAIIGYSEMLQEEAEDLGEQTFLPDLVRINSAGRHLLGLINDILDPPRSRLAAWTCSWKPSTSDSSSTMSKRSSGR
jgi:GAF domain-containing protein